jgi:putative NIF3 family GTP cyclohydrolase 1 type 2
VKVLLDENLDHALGSLLAPHEVVTVAFMGWAGLKNGELLQAAEEQGIQVLLTGDTTLHRRGNRRRGARQLPDGGLRHIRP